MDNQQGSRREAGITLRKTAKDCLMEFCYTESEAYRIAERGDLDEIERLTGAISILDAVIHKLCPILAEQDKIVPPRNLFDTIIYSDTPKEDIKTLLCQFERCSDPRRAELIMFMLSAAHDEWVKLNDEAFFDPEKEYLQCRYMPLELIGFDAARQYFTYIERLLDVFGWIVDDKLILIAYRAMQDYYYLRHQLSSDERLIVYVADAEYKALSPKIRRALKGNIELAKKMVYS